MRIEIYSSFAPENRLEEIEWSGTFASYLDSVVPTWRTQDSQPIAVTLDGNPWPQSEWGAVLAAGALVSVRVLPAGGIFKALGNIIGKLFSFLGGGSGRGRSIAETPQGREIQASAGKANTAKLGGTVPELAGRFIRYPDYLTPPRRFFVNKREQWLMFLANVGPGYYQILPDEVRVGGTTFLALGEDAAYSIFSPGADLSSIEPAQIWYTAPEVGGTSSGSAGLEMTTSPANRTNLDPAYYLFNGNVITRSDGEFPSGWGAGTQVFVQYQREYDVVTHVVPPDGGDPGYSVSRITGHFGHLPTVAVGTLVIRGPIGSTTTRWRVRTIVADLGGGRYTLEFNDDVTGDPVLLTAGTGISMIFGADIARLILDFTPTSITVSPGGFETSLPLVAPIRLAGGDIYGEWTNEFAATPDGAVTSLLEIDTFFPQGLCFLSDTGEVQARTVSVEYQYRNLDTGATALIRRTFTDATVDQIGFSEQIPVAPMRPMVRCRRVGSESTSTQIQDKCQWYGLKARLADHFSYPGWTTISVALRSGGKLAQQSENQVNLIATRVLSALTANGTWGAAVPTRDISAFARHILNSSGVEDGRIDMAELARLDQIWKARGETLDHLFDATTVKAALEVAFGAGMAEFTCGDGLIRPVRDGVRSTFEQGYSPLNMTTGLRRNASGFSEIQDYDGVDVEYMDGETWTKKTVQCRLPGDVGARVKKVTLDGVIDATRAYRIGMRERSVMRYRRKTYSFSTELDALNSNYLSYVALRGDDAGYGQSAIMTAIRQNTAGLAVISSSEELTWTEGVDHVIAYRKANGDLAGPFPALRGATPREVMAALPYPYPWPVVTLHQEPPHIFFGTRDTFCFPALLTAINPRGLDEVSVTAVNYDPRVFDYDNAFPPA